MLLNYIGTRGYLHRPMRLVVETVTPNLPQRTVQGNNPCGVMIPKLISRAIDEIGADRGWPIRIHAPASGTSWLYTNQLYSDCFTNRQNKIPYVLECSDLDMEYTLFLGVLEEDMDELVRTSFSKGLHLPEFDMPVLSNIQVPGQPHWEVSDGNGTLEVYSGDSHDFLERKASTANDSSDIDIIHVDYGSFLASQLDADLQDEFLDFIRSSREELGSSFDDQWHLGPPTAGNLPIHIERKKTEVLHLLRRVRPGGLIVWSELHCGIPNRAKSEHFPVSGNGVECVGSGYYEFVLEDEMWKGKGNDLYHNREIYLCVCRKSED